MSENWKLNFTMPFDVHFSLPVQNYTIPVLEIEMLAIFAVTQITHFFLSFAGLPKLVSELLAGVFLGDAVAATFIEKYASIVFRFVNQEILGTISLFGYSMFMFLIGVKMDPSIVFKTGTKAFYTGALAMLAPLLFGTIAQLAVGQIWNLHKQGHLQIVFVLTTHSLTSFPVIACLLGDLKILSSELGRLALSSAIVSDVFGTFLTSVTTMAKVMDHSIPIFIRDLTLLIMYLFFVVYVARPAMLWVVKQTPEGRPVKKVYISLIILLVLASGLLSNFYHFTLVFGPFILGLAVPDGPPLGSTLVKKFDVITNGVFMPIFTTICMLKASPHDLKFSTPLEKANAVVVSVIVISKFLFVLIPPLFCKLPLKDSIALSLIMSYKGVVEMATYSFARDSKVIDFEVYAFVMATILFTSITVPLLVNVLYDPKRKYGGYQKRNLMHSQYESEIRILACANRSDNSAAIINLLDTSCPTKENPIAVYVLHLIELVGRASPVFISHQLQKKTLTNYSYSENVILSFTHFQRENEGATSVSVFTAISPTTYMHDDICTLALNKLTSLIILPFHRKWSADGSTVESEDQTIRSLNCSVLETAPCSVSILVTRGHVKNLNSAASKSETYRVAMIYMGGKDDREALTFCKRMVKDSCIKLSVINFIGVSENGDDDENHWDRVLDNEMLKEIVQNNVVGNGHVRYVEEMVRDGTQTAQKIRAMANDYELFVVGRRYNVKSTQTVGLDQWSEFPELGVVGDLLASSDFVSKSQVLVIQQQQTS
ncbi:cation/H(+) antiporter 4-like [Ziziphus jujuba]|uniref:Cation/H(+) antiporter 4-like n=1 Tax=Ziziphus jujuba TaxID=326968 RepID=A0A6P6FSE2_ZIZJJ|nr:cation/H(+) antiporter 4-like [Ziziphus jujuba]